MSGSSDQMCSDSTPLTIVYDAETQCDVYFECVMHSENGTYFGSDNYCVLTYFKNNLFLTSKVTIFPLREVVMETQDLDLVICYIVKGQIILQSSICQKDGDFFLLPQGDMFTMRNLLEEEATLIFTNLHFWSEAD